MYLSFFRLAYLGDNESLAIWSSAPYIDEDGDEIEAKIEVVPLNGEGDLHKERLKIVFSVDDADHLARRLWQVVTDARAGRYRPEPEFGDLPPPPPLR